MNQSGWATFGQKVKYVDICLNYQSGGMGCSPQGVTCGWQFLDTDSGYQNEQYYQYFMMPVGNEYQLTIDWISENPPLISLLLTTSTGFQVTWNGAVVYSAYNTACSLMSSTFYVMSIANSNELVISGLGHVDGYGILIRHIQLSQLVYSSNTSTNSANSTTNATSLLNSNTTTNGSNTSNTTSNTNTTNNMNVTNSTNKYTANYTSSNITSPNNTTSNNSSNTNTPSSNPAIYTFDQL